MKIVKEFEYEGYDIIIKAKYESKSYDVSKSIVVSRMVDAIKFDRLIYKDGDKLDESKTVATPESFYEKKHWLSRKRFVSLRESYDFALEDIEEKAVKWIDNDIKTQKIKMSDTEITDGLPDSLNSL